MIEDFIQAQLELQYQLNKTFGEICLILIKDNEMRNPKLPESLSIVQKKFKKEAALLFSNSFLNWNQTIFRMDKISNKVVDLSDITPKLRNFTPIQKKFILSILGKSQYFDAGYFIDICLLVKNNNSSIILTKRLKNLNQKIKLDLSL